MTQRQTFRGWSAELIKVTSGKLSVFLEFLYGEGRYFSVIRLCLSNTDWRITAACDMFIQ